MKGKITAVTRGTESYPPTITIQFDKPPGFYEFKCGEEIMVGKLADEVLNALNWGLREGIREERERWVHDLRTMTNGRWAEFKDDEYDPEYDAHGHRIS